MQGSNGGPALTRRTLFGGIVAIAGLTAAGCSRAQKTADANPPTTTTNGAPEATAAAMTVYRDPNCGCCEAWADLARQAGYRVNLVDRPDMPAIKREYGVPEQLASCHTARVGDYVVEGHVPLEDVRRLLSEKPKNIAGIAVPGMPRGSPGMEMPDGSKDAFQVMAFDRSGRISVFS